MRERERKEDKETEKKSDNEKMKSNEKKSGTASKQEKVIDKEGEKREVQKKRGKR